MSEGSLLREHYLTQPHEVSFETLALCNAACVFCPYPRLARQGTELPATVIHSLIEQMAQFKKPFFVSPFKVNEPLLDKRLPQLCREIEQYCPEATLRLFTNGQALTERHIDWIARLKRLDTLWISLNSTDPLEYGERMKCSYAMVQFKLDRLHRAAESGEFTHPVILSRVMTGSVRDGSTVLEGDLADLKFRLDTRRRWPLFKSFLIKRDAWLDFVAPSDPRVPTAPCARWFELNITATGKAVLCCMDGEEQFVLGDVAVDPLLTIYNQPHLRARREKAANRDGITPCSTCSY